MGDLENDEVLPDGWRVELRVRKNGTKDKIVIEKAVAEGLPPGWIKEIKVTKTGHKVRRDPYYTDPVSGYRFRSMKDAVRYIETGEIGRLAYKPKDKDRHDEEDFEGEKCSSPTTAKKQKLAVPGTEANITGQSTKLSEVVKNEDALHSVSTGECIPCPEHQGAAGTEGSNLSEANDSDKIDGGKVFDKNVLLSTSEVGVLPDKLSSETEEIRDESMKTTSGKCRSRKKKVLDLPRRASKRLAGLALDPTPELKTSKGTRRAYVKQSDEIVASTDKGSCSDSRGYKASQQPDQLEPKPEANCAIETSKSTEVLTESRVSKRPSGDPNGHAKKIKMEYKTEKEQECAVVAPMKNEDRIETSKADEKSGPAIDLPFDDLLSDPCIAFAIKTLTGVTFETSSNDKEVSLESNNGKSGGLAILEEPARKQTENESSKKQENLATPQERVSNVDSNYKTDELGNPLDLPFADIWRDPCIEFAIKTLTGTIPVGYDLDMQNYIQQQLDSSQAQASNNFCQTELCQQYDALEKPLSREQAWTGNSNIQNSGGASFHQQSEKRYNECH